MERYLKAGFSDPGELYQHKLEKLQAVLNRVARNVPFYQSLFRERGISPEDVGSLEELSKLPFTTREDLDRNYPYQMFAVPLRDIVRIHPTSGTVGLTTVVGYTGYDLTLWRDLVARALSTVGVGETDIVQIVFDKGLANWGRHFKEGAEGLNASVIPMNYLSAKRQVMVLRDYKSSCLVTTPSYGLHLAEVMEKAGLSPDEIALKKGIFIGEPLTQKRRAALKERMGVTPTALYGLSEVPGPAVAYECAEKQGLHLSEDHFHPEIVDPVTGEPKGPGEPGELVLTTLTTMAYPLIRFRTGDRTRLLTEPCPCGRTFVRMEEVAGRTDDIFVIRGLKVHPGQVTGVLADLMGDGPPEHVIFLEKRGMLDSVVLWIAIDKSLLFDEIKRFQSIIWRIEDDLEETIGLRPRVKLVEPKTLAPFREKIGQVVDLRQGA